MKLSDFIHKNSSEGDRFSHSSREKDLEFILDIVKKINSKLSLSDVLNDVLSYSIKITNTDRGFVLLKNPLGDLKFELGIDGQGNKISQEDFKISSRVAYDVFNTGYSRFIEGAQSDREFGQSQSIANLSLQTILCSPLTVEDNVIGVIYVDSTTLKKISLREITYTFEILAGQAAIAIRNAQLFEKMNIEKQRAEAFDRLKLEFLDQVSHEIRTPLNVIMSFSQLLGEELKGKVDADVEPALKAIKTAGTRIVRTIDLILKMSELKSGTYHFEYSKIDLEKLTSEILAGYREQISVKKLSVAKNITTGQPVIGDKEGIAEMLNNVIDNAVKFTEEGKIDIVIMKKGTNTILEIKDTGIGISKEFLPSVYDPFSQEESGYTRNYEGIGLGLTLVKYLAEINGCSIDINSEKGIGTSFRFQFSEY